MRRMITVSLLCIVGVLGLGAAVATSQTPATDQYGTTPTLGQSTNTTGTTTATTPTNTGSSGTPTNTGSSGTPTTTGTTPGGGNGSSNGGGNGNNNGGGNGNSGGGNGIGSPSNGGAVSGSVSATTPVIVPVVTFGFISKELRDDIRASLERAGLQVRFISRVSVARMRQFLKSPLVDRLSDKSLRAAGRAFGAQVVTGTPLARLVFARVFGARTAFPQVGHAILTRRVNLPADQVSFAKGVAEGLRTTDIPLAYVERTVKAKDRAKRSFVKQFRALKVLTVGDVDKTVGQERLAQIMLGNITTQKAVNAVKAKRASAAITDADGSSGTVPWVLLVMLLGGVGFVASGVVRQRGRATGTR